MAFTLQNDSGGVAGANAYIDAAFFKDYHRDRGTLEDGLETSAINQAIIRATDYLDARFNFIGERQNVNQTTEWPRINAYDRSDDYIDGIPDEVKEACAEYAAIAISQTLNPTPDRDATGRKVQSKSEAVGPISERTVYTSGAVFELPKYPIADRKLIARGLVERAGRTIRG